MLKRCASCFYEFDDQFQVCPKCGYADNDPGKETFYLKPGTILADRYMIGEGINHGGFGITYLAWDTKFEVTVAIKEYFWKDGVKRVPDSNNVALFAKKNKRYYTDNFKRFIDEARNLAKFRSNRNIVNVFEYFEENDTAYIVMEYIDGRTLKEYVDKKGGKLEIENIISISEMICAALKAIHKEHIIHRDIAPDNIMIDNNGNVKIIDFGAARFSTGDNVMMRDVVKIGHSPIEQYNKTIPQGPWSDIYSFGTVIYELLTGIKPDEATVRANEDNVKPPHDLDNEIPEYLSSIIMRAMAMNCFLRFQSVEEIEKALFKKKQVRTPEQESRRRIRKKAITISGCVTAAVGISFVLAASFLSRYVLPTDITVWYISDSDSVLNQNKTNGLHSVADDFKELYPQVDVELVAVTAEDYTLKLEQAVIDGKAPDLFECSDIDSDIYEQCSDLSYIINEPAAEGCCFLDQYKAVYPDGKKMPIGFNIPMIYINQSLCETDYTPEAILRSNSEIDDIITEPKLIDILPNLIIVGDKADGELYHYNSARIVVNKENSEYFKEIFPHANVDTAENDDMLLNRETAYYFGTSESYLLSLLSLPGQVIAVPIYSDTTAEEVECMFDYEWSVYPNSKNKEKAACKLLAYMLTENAQDEMMVRNQSCNIPLQRNVIESYSDVYENVFSSMPEEIENYVLK